MNSKQSQNTTFDQELSQKSIKLQQQINQSEQLQAIIQKLQQQCKTELFKMFEFNKEIDKLTSAEKSITKDQPESELKKHIYKKFSEIKNMIITKIKQFNQMQQNFIRSTRQELNKNNTIFKNLIKELNKMDKQSQQKQSNRKNVESNINLRKINNNTQSFKNLKQNNIEKNTQKIIQFPKINLKTNVDYNTFQAKEIKSKNLNEKIDIEQSNKFKLQKKKEKSLISLTQQKKIPSEVKNIKEQNNLEYEQQRMLSTNNVKGKIKQLTQESIK